MSITLVITSAHNFFVQIVLSFKYKNNLKSNTYSLAKYSNRILLLIFISLSFLNNFSDFLLNFSSFLNFFFLKHIWLLLVWRTEQELKQTMHRRSNISLFRNWMILFWTIICFRKSTKIFAFFFAVKSKLMTNCLKRISNQKTNVKEEERWKIFWIKFLNGVDNSFICNSVNKKNLNSPSKLNFANDPLERWNNL